MVWSLHLGGKALRIPKSDQALTTQLELLLYAKRAMAQALRDVRPLDHVSQPLLRVTLLLGDFVTA